MAQHRAQQFPNVAEEGLSDEEPVQLRYVPGQYDRIVCDVPCCGDGTLRKAPDLWRRWVPSYAMKLHALQVQIAMRGLALLRVGGIMAYSTCTMNPLEDEAVVATILQRCGGAVQLMDCSKRLPELIRYPGLATWQVYFFYTHGPTFVIPANHPRFARQLTCRMAPLLFVAGN